MNSDLITAGFIGISGCIGLTNTYALLVDKAAKGIRPYSNGYVVFSNAWLSIQFWSLGQRAASISCLFCLIVALANFTLIVLYAKRQNKRV